VKFSRSQFYVQNPSLPTWLARALNLSYQGGVGIAIGQPINFSDGAGAKTWNLIPGFPSSASMLLGLTVQATTAASREFQLTSAGQQTGGNVTNPIDWANVTIAADGEAAWKDIAGAADARIYIPPGYNLTLESDLAAGESALIGGFLLTGIPAGFRPW
jgi:hypothetical protein